MCQLADVFAGLCKQSNVRFKPAAAKHQDIADSVRGITDAKGVCFALTCLYLSRYFKTLMEDDPYAGQSFGDLAKSIGQNARLRMVLRQLQQGEEARNDLFGKGLAALNDESRLESSRLRQWGALTRSVGFKAIFTDALAAFGLTATHIRNDGLSAEDTDYWSAKDDPPYRRISRFIWSNEGINLIKFQTHYVGAVTDHVRTKYKFLDVNAGQAITDNVGDYRNFLNAYLRSDIAAAYATQKSKAVYVVQAY